MNKNTASIPTPPLPSHELGCDRQNALRPWKESWPCPTDILEVDWCGWLKQFAYRLYGQYDISPVGCVVLPLSVISAIAGPVYWIEARGGLSVPAPFSNLFLGVAGSMHRTAADDVYLIPRGLLGGASFRPISDRKATNRLYRQLLSQLAAVNADIEKTQKQATGPKGGLEQSPSRLDDLLKLQAAAKEAIRGFISKHPPLLLAEGGNLETLLTPGEHCYDATMHHVSTSGGAISRLIAAPARVLSDLSDLAANVFIPQLQSTAVTTVHRDMLSHSIFANEHQTRQVLTSKPLQNSGFLDSFLVTDLRNPHPLSHDIQLDGSDPWGEFTSIIERLLAARSAMETSLFEISGEAANIFADYLDQRHPVAISLGAACPAILDRLGPLVQKIALGLHLARGRFEVKEVDPATVTSACTLVDALVASHLDTMAEPSGPEAALPAPEGVDTQIEIIVTKLRIRGRLTQRELARTFHRQSADKWMPALSRAIELGRVARDENGCLMLAAEDASPLASRELSVES